MTDALSLRGVTVLAGGVPKVMDIDLDLAEGEIHVLLGPNGAGKSTLMRALTGQQKRTSGRIELLGAPSPNSSAAIARKGMVLAPQNAPVFPSLTIAESLRLRGSGAFDAELKVFPELRPILNRTADKLSGGQRQMLSMAMCLRLRPRVLLLDEPSSGLAPLVVTSIFETIQRVRDSGVSVLMVEQNAAQTLAFADRASLLEHGRVTLTGPAHQLRDDPHIRSAYLGV
jgi:branched-chain amino acid transport system ATP-binding protein